MVRCMRTTLEIDQVDDQTETYVQAHQVRLRNQHNYEIEEGLRSEFVRDRCENYRNQINLKILLQKV